MTTTKFNPKTGQNNPLRRVPGGFLTTSQREQLARAGRDIHGNQILDPNPHRIHFDEIELPPKQPFASVAEMHDAMIDPSEHAVAYSEAIVKPVECETMDLDTFEELRETARRRKKGFKRVAQDAGWTLNDPNNKAVLLPESWTRQI